MWRYIKICSGWASFLQNYVAQISNRYHVTRSVSQEFSIISQLRSRVVQYIILIFAGIPASNFAAKLLIFF